MTGVARCTHGHEMRADNLVIREQRNASGTRTWTSIRCLACKREQARVYAERHRHRVELADATPTQPSEFGGRRCEVCELMLDYRTPRQVREGKPAEPHRCIDASERRRNHGNVAEGATTGSVRRA